MTARLARASRPLACLIVVLALAWLHATRVADEPYPTFDNPRFPWVAAFAATMVLAGYALGLPDEARSRTAVAWRSLTTGASALLAISAMQLLLGQPLMPRFVALGAPVILLPVDLLAWNLWGDARSRITSRTRALVVADSSEVATLRADLASDVERPAVIVAALDPDSCMPTKHGDAPLVDAAHEHGANLVVLDLGAQSVDAVVAQAARLHAEGVSVRTLSMFCSDHLGKLPVSELQRVSLLFDVGELHSGYYPRCKRGIDIVVASLGLLVLLPAVPVVWFVNLFGNRGPLWYRQTRVGRAGRPVTLLKFRTMLPDTMLPEPAPAGEAGASVEAASPWTTTGDHRITRFGHWLRSTHLDELPQLLGVLRGELSLVGPRPEQPGYVAELTEKLPFYEVRLLVRPGLTGWAQVKYGYASDTEDAREKLQYDIHYLRNQSLVLDLRILGRTVRHIVAGGGR